MKQERLNEAGHGRYCLIVEADQCVIHQFNPAKDYAISKSRIVYMHRIMSINDLFGN